VVLRDELWNYKDFILEMFFWSDGYGFEYWSTFQDYGTVGMRSTIGVGSFYFFCGFFEGHGRWMRLDGNAAFMAYRVGKLMRCYFSNIILYYHRHGS